jgi:hypothetical protein
MRQTSERLTLGVFAILSLAVRAVAFFRYRFDSDEPQHLHVAWGWTAGLLQYRDLFDNHAPLFQMLTAPVLSWAGERPDVLLVMRAPMLLLYAIVLASTYILGRRLYSARVGIWATLLLSLYPTFFLKSIEYRTDNLWNAAWCLALVVLTGGPLTVVRLFVAGLFLGCALATSLKTLLLLLTLVASGAVTYLFAFSQRSHWRAQRLSAALLAGTAVIPAAIVGHFAARGAWPNLWYCVIQFNELIASGSGRVWTARLAYVPVLLGILWLAWRMRPKTADIAVHWRFFLGFAAAFFTATLGGFWILISPRDFLAILPIVAIFFAAAIDSLDARVPVYAGISLLFLGAIWHYSDHFANGTEEHITMMRQVLGLTRPEDPIIDLKGETIYRRRPYYYILEFITRREIRRGVIVDSIPEDVVRAQCHVAQADSGFFPPRGRAFLNANFLDVGRLRAAGQWIKEDGSFTIAIPGRYVIVTRDGEPQGILDATPYRGERSLELGIHRFEPVGPTQRMACLWAPAFARGYSPFHLRDREFYGSPVFAAADVDHRTASGRRRHRRRWLDAAGPGERR